MCRLLLGSSDQAEDALGLSEGSTCEADPAVRQYVEVSSRLLCLRRSRCSAVRGQTNTLGGLNVDALQAGCGLCSLCVSLGDHTVVAFQPLHDLSLPQSRHELRVPT